MLQVLEQDFGRLPELLGRPVAIEPVEAEPCADDAGGADTVREVVQLGLF